MDVYEPGQHEAEIPYMERYFQAYPADLTRLSATHALLVEQRQQGIQQGKQEGLQEGKLQGLQQGELQGIKQFIATIAAEIHHLARSG